MVKLKVFITVKDWSYVPSLHQLELAKEMWERSNNISRAGDHDIISKCTSLALSWNIWLDEPQLVDGKEYSVAYIYFDFNKDLNLISIEVEEKALLIDLRAFHRAIVFLSKNTSGIIRHNNIDFSIDEYTQKHKDILELSFEQALKNSF